MSYGNPSNYNPQKEYGFSYIDIRKNKLQRKVGVYENCIINKVPIINNEDRYPKSIHEFNNTNNNNTSAIIAGRTNTNNMVDSAIIGGVNNTINVFGEDGNSIIGGGQINTISGGFEIAIIGGRNNTASGFAGGF